MDRLSGSLVGDERLEDRALLVTVSEDVPSKARYTMRYTCNCASTSAVLRALALKLATFGSISAWTVHVVSSTTIAIAQRRLRGGIMFEMQQQFVVHVPSEAFDGATGPQADIGLDDSCVGPFGPILFTPSTFFRPGHWSAIVMSPSRDIRTTRTCFRTPAQYWLVAPS